MDDARERDARERSGAKGPPRAAKPGCGAEPRVGNDESLLERVRQGDETAFSALYERHQRAIYRYAMHMCGPAAADDVVQETFLVLIRDGRGYKREKGTLGA